MKSLASCMALGVGAKIENVSSSTWLIVTPFKKMIYYILKLTCSFQWRKDLTLPGPGGTTVNQCPYFLGGRKHLSSNFGSVLLIPHHFFFSPLFRVVVGWMRDEIMSFLNPENCLRLLDFLCSFCNLKAGKWRGIPKDWFQKKKQSKAYYFYTYSLKK